ncbi:MAG: hypothetical protein ACOWWH_13635 [Eubacteriaceae bacterium]
MYKKNIIIFLFVILIISIIACSNIVSKNKNTETLKGIIQEVNESSLLISTDNDELYLIHLNNNTIYKNNISKDFYINNAIEVLFNGVILESSPMQITAMEITMNDQMISLDPREFISGIIGVFPSTVLNEDNNNIQIEIETPFAIELPIENNLQWTYTSSSDDIVFLAGGADTQHDEIVYYYYWGFKINKSGEYVLTFTNEDLESGEELVFNINVPSKE